MIGRRALGVTALLFLVLGTGPTVGDVGSCGREATDLQEPAYARAKKRIDCDRCLECGLSTERCRRACDSKVPSEVDWPSTCRPIFHDGDVCVRALGAASCDDYATFVDDVAPVVPTECDFCKEKAGDGG